MKRTEHVSSRILMFLYMFVVEIALVAYSFPLHDCCSSSVVSAMFSRRMSIDYNRAFMQFPLSQRCFEKIKEKFTHVLTHN